MNKSLVIKRLRKEDKGQGLVEYAMILALISLIAYVSLGKIGKDVIPNPFDTPDEIVEVEEVDSAYMSVEIVKNTEDDSYDTPEPIESVKSFVVDSMGEKKYIYQFPVDFEHHLEDDLFKRPYTDQGDGLPYVDGLPYGDGIYGGRLDYRVNGMYLHGSMWRYNGKDMLGVSTPFITQQHTIISGNPSSSIHSVYNNKLMESLTEGMGPREYSKDLYEWLLPMEPQMKEMKDIMTEEEFSDFMEKFLNSIVYDGNTISIPEEFKDIGFNENFALYEMLELLVEEALSVDPFNLVNKLQGSFENTNSWVVTSPEPLSTIELEIGLMKNIIPN